MQNAENLVGIMLSDRYDVLRKIGSGGMATVYKAHDKVLDRDVAIKILRDNYEEKQEIVSNFIKEARSAASLVHPNVVSVYDVCEDNGINYMVMEYVDGKSLMAYIKEHKKLAWQEACDYAMQIAQGIQSAHDKGIIHRDIKPQNILIAPGGVLKVADFGIAKAIETDKTIGNGTALGSVHYISPEQARGGYTDFRSDIYSLGVVLYEMLAGKVPFDGDTPVSVALKHIEKEPVNVKCINMDIPADLAYVTMKAMSKNQNDRYQSMNDLLNDLRAVLADETLPSKENEVIAEENNDGISYDNDDASGKRDVVDNNRKKPKKKSKKKHKEDRNSVILALSTVGVLLVAVAALILFLMHPSNKQVPDFSGMTLEQASELAAKKGYKIDDEIEYSLSDTVPENYIVTQMPEAGTESPKSEPIRLVVSLGTSGGGIEVPSVEKLSVDEAGLMIEEQTLSYKIVSEYSRDVEDGYVIRQIPAPGTHINSGDIVTLHVSVGPDTDKSEKNTVAVPNVVGMYRDNAESTLGMSNLGIGTVSKKPSNEPEGKIIMQSPKAGSVVKEATTVTIVISSGSTATTLGSEYGGGSVLEQQTAPQPQISEQGGEQAEEPAPQTETPQQEQPVVQQESVPPAGSQSKLFTVKIPDAAGEKVNVEIVVDGRVVHSAVHSRTEGVVTVEITGEGSASVQAYIDGAKVSDKTVTF